jgi:hypothetical protein
MPQDVKRVINDIVALNMKATLQSQDEKSTNDVGEEDAAKYAAEKLQRDIEEYMKGLERSGRYVVEAWS